MKILNPVCYEDMQVNAVNWVTELESSHTSSLEILVVEKGLSSAVTYRTLERSNFVFKDNMRSAHKIKSVLSLQQIFLLKENTPHSIYQLWFQGTRK